MNNGQAMLKLLSDRPVAYHPDVARIVGGVKAAVFLCQLLYWTGKGKRPDGFIWKTQKEMEEETALSRGEQEGARKKLCKLGILEEKLAGIPAKLHYRVDTNRFLELINVFYDKQDCGKQASKIAENKQTIPESTQRVQQHDARASAQPSTEPTPEPQELVGEALITQYFGEKPEREYIEPTPHWTEQAVQDWATWGYGSEEMKRQIAAFGSNGHSVRKLGYELEQQFGLRPLWSDKKAVKTWMSGLATCLQEADYDPQLVIRACRELAEAELTISNPWSLRKKTAALAARRRSPHPTSLGIDAPSPIPQI